MKPKELTNELTIIQEVEGGVEDIETTIVGEGGAGSTLENHASEELSEFMRDLDLDRYEQMI